MTDRDRLAADLHDVLKWAGMGDFNVVADIVAARLIALGWTRLDEDPHLCLSCGDIYGVPPLLDEERLARALNSLAIPDEWLLRDRTPFAAAIAKAYREDTDAD